MEKNEIIRLIQQKIDAAFNQELYLPKSVKQRHIDGQIIHRGNIADRPSDGDTEVQVYFAEDESKLYIWNTENEAWESATLS
jgi:hypothetical protein